jgi:hypothetical protein
MLQRVIRGFLGRRQAARRQAVARQQADKVASLLAQIEGLSTEILTKQQTVLKNDKAIPQSKQTYLRIKSIFDGFHLGMEGLHTL